MMYFSVLFGLFFATVWSNGITPDFDVHIQNFQAFTVASNETDGYKHFVQTAKIYKIPLQVIGLGEKWKGGDMTRAGGGYKINLLREALKPYRDDDQRIIMFTDSYDVLYLSNVEKIVNKFLAAKCNILFSAEPWLWPNKSLEDQYPSVDEGYKYLNSGGFIGYAASISKLLEEHSVDDKDDDQQYYSNLFVNQEIRETYNIKLDNKAEIFQNLFGVADDVILKPAGDQFVLHNVKFDTYPSVLHGNGLSKLIEFRSLGNYLAERWSAVGGCLQCDDGNLPLENLSEKSYPVVVIAIFIDKPTPFLKEFFDDVFNQTYPKNRVHLFAYNAVAYHQKEIDDILSQNQEMYKHRFKVVSSENNVDTVTARNLAMDYCVQKSCDSYLYLESDAHLDSSKALYNLVQANKSVIAPMLIRPFKAWSNFWGALDKSGYYRRSFDYMDIVNYQRKSIWNVPYITSCYLINGTVLKSPELRPDYAYQELDYDMAFCSDMRNKGIYLYVDNRQEFGHLITLEGFDTTRTNPNLYEMSRNRYDWEQVYLHPEYEQNFEANHTHLQPCPDVYWFPIVSPRFCKEFIEIMENFGQWSDGSNNDNRLQSGYEAVPTRDIHMNQVGLEEQWLEFLNMYIRPLQEAVFIGYFHNPSKSLMNFVVRYKPDEQPSLRPHHDSSTYTINIALNRPKIDYEGGGCRFLRYNCSVTNMKLGWTLMHPGRLTHFHEGLLVTNGTRYIMISFVDP